MDGAESHPFYTRFAHQPCNVKSPDSSVYGYQLPSPLEDEVILDAALADKEVSYTFRESLNLQCDCVDIVLETSRTESGGSKSLPRAQREQIEATGKEDIGAESGPKNAGEKVQQPPDSTLAPPVWLEDSTRCQRNIRRGR